MALTRLLTQCISDLTESSVFAGAGALNPLGCEIPPFLCFAASEECRGRGLVGLTHTRHLLGPCRASPATHSAFIEAYAKHFRPDGVVSFSVVI